MAEIESVIGKTSSKETSEVQPNKRVFTVEDKSESQSFGQNPKFKAQTMSRQSSGNRFEIPRMTEAELKEFEARRQEALSLRDRISPEAKERIEFLTGLGRIKDNVEVEGIRFDFQSLKGIEQEEIFDELGKHGEMTALKMQCEVRAHTLARALTHIQNKPFEAVIESNDVNDKVSVIKGLDENLLDFLYKWYQKNILKLGQEKYAIRDKEDLKEVSEAIKK